MGHDICGFKNHDKEREGEEIAYLRRSAGDELARDIYAALKVTEYDCGCSGCGKAAHFTEAKLRDALAKIPNDEYHERERQFLTNCIEKGEGGAWIAFL